MHTLALHNTGSFGVPPRRSPVAHVRITMWALLAQRRGMPACRLALTPSVRRRTPAFAEFMGCQPSHAARVVKREGEGRVGVGFGGRGPSGRAHFTGERARHANHFSNIFLIDFGSSKNITFNTTFNITFQITFKIICFITFKITVPITYF